MHTKILNVMVVVSIIFFNQCSYSVGLLRGFDGAAGYVHKLQTSSRHLHKWILIFLYFLSAKLWDSAAHWIIHILWKCPELSYFCFWLMFYPPHGMFLFIIYACEIPNLWKPQTFLPCMLYISLLWNHTPSLLRS